VGIALENKKKIIMFAFKRCFLFWRRGLLRQYTIVTLFYLTLIVPVDSNRFAAYFGKVFGMMIRLEESKY